MSDVRRNEDLPWRAVVRQPPDEGGKPHSLSCISTASRSVRPLAREALPAMSLTPVAPFTEIANDLEKSK
jgi:hypothetical protein